MAHAGYRREGAFDVMRVVYFHQHFSTPSGAAGTRSYEMARRLVSHGHEVLMVCGSYGQGKTGLDGPFRDGRREGNVDGIHVVEFELSYSNQDGFLKRTMTFLRYSLSAIGVALRERYDVSVATTTPLTAGIPAILARWLRRKPYVFEVRDLWPELPRAMGVIKNPIMLAAMSVLEWLSYRNADRCIGLSPGIVEGIAARGVPRSRITMVPNGCDLDIFAGEVVSWRPEGVAPEALLALFAGTHGDANGLDAVLDAALELKKAGRRDIVLLLVGNGKQKPHLMARAAELGLENICFHAPVDKRSLAGLMRSADIGLQILADVPAFYFGTSPNKFFDYLAAGLPVLTNYPGWVAEIVSQSGAGFAVPPRDPQAFARALMAAADDRQALARMAGAAATVGEQQFRRDDLADRWVSWVVAGRAV